MITKTYKPTISKHDIEIVLSSDVVDHSEKTANELAEERRKYRKRSLKQTGLGLFVGIILLGCGLLWRVLFSGNWIGSFMVFAGLLMIVMAPFIYSIFLVRSKTKVSQDDPKKVYRSFLYELLCEEMPDPARAYQLVAPSVLKNTTITIISNAYEQIQQDILSTIKSQETATCIKCSKEESGLWTGKWKLSSEYLQNKKYFLRCGNCNSLYCETCFLGIPTSGTFYKRRNCPNCEKQMEDQSLDVFVPNPEVRHGVAIDEISVKYETNQRVAQLHAKVKIWSSLEKLVKSSEPDLFGTEGDYIGLDDRGKAICHFHNKAVKTGDKWYLLSALPNG